MMEQYRSLEVLFSGTAPGSGGWVGWGLNPDFPGQMIGTQAFIAFQATNGTTVLTYNVTTATKRGSPLSCSPISYRVSGMEAQVTSGNTILLYVRLELPPGSPTVLNHVWNRGASVSNFRPSAHMFSPSDLSTFATIEMARPGGYSDMMNMYSGTSLPRTTATTTPALLSLSSLLLVSSYFLASSTLSIL